MIQKVLRVGSSAAVTIPKKSLKELGLKIGDLVLLEVNASTRTVSVRSTRSNRGTARQKSIAAMTANFIKRYRADLEALAR